jgi:hypothetical protein
MDDFMRLDEIIARCDANDARYEAWQAKCAELKKRQAGELVYKTIEQSIQPRAVVKMDPQTDAAWNAWAQSVVRHELAAQPLFSKAQKEVIAEVISRLRAEWRREISEAVGSLRADMTVQNAISKGEIAEIKSKRDAA